MLAAFLADGSFDYVMAAMFLHHLSDEEVVQVLREMNRVAARGVIISDLLRNRRAYAWITFFTLFSIPMVKHDGRAKVLLTHHPSKKQPRSSAPPPGWIMSLITSTSAIGL